VLNGAHTSSVLAAFLAGLNTVGEMMEDALFGRFIRQAVFAEILPALQMEEIEKRQYAEAVLERFRNPFIRHELISISLNSVSKWKVRVLPSLLDSLANTGTLPPALVFSLAALIRFYKVESEPGAEASGRRAGGSYPIREEGGVVSFFQAQWNAFAADHDIARLTTAVLANDALWGRDLNALPGMTDAVTASLQAILTSGIRAATESVIR
jgi:tagaturonate reductase